MNNHGKFKDNFWHNFIDPSYNGNHEHHIEERNIYGTVVLFDQTAFLMCQLGFNVDPLRGFNDEKFKYYDKRNKNR